MHVPFNRPYTTGKEFDYIQQAIHDGRLSANGPFTQKCQSWLENTLQCHKAYLTHSCTHALELAALLINLQPGDEVIMPSYTFVSTANAFVLRGATPVFIDIRGDDLDIDESLIENAITNKTRAIVPVHYAGVSCAMEEIMNIARRHKLWVIEDAAQGLMASYKDKPLGSFGHLSAISFHDTKNLTSGEGGALLINDPDLVERAEILLEKGTNRRRFFRGQTDKYTWVDVGSSFLPSEIEAAFLWAQFEAAEEITARRLSHWQHYHQLFQQLEDRGFVRRPHVPLECKINGHIYYLLAQNLAVRTKLLAFLATQEVECFFHFVPLHSSQAGLKYARTAGSMSQTDSISERLFRLPLWVNLPVEASEFVFDRIATFFLTNSPTDWDKSRAVEIAG